MVNPAIASPEPPRRSYLTVETTVASWLNTRDHKRVGVLYMISVNL